MIKSFVARFGLRWLVSILGLYVASAILGAERLSVNGNHWTLLMAGFFLALVNMALKPILIILSFPAILLSLGLFMLVLNGLLIVIASKIYEPLYVKNLWFAILGGVIIGLVNYLLSRILKDV